MSNSKDRKKVGTLTFHIAHNYGALLQAYALPKAVEDLGYECEVIHYCFPYIYNWGHIEKFSELIEKHGFIGGGLMYIKILLKGAYNPWLKRYKFERFIYETLPISKISYHSVEDMNNMDYDVILFGSDQIWNSKLTDGIEKGYAGGFECLEKTKKIAYAASCGRSEFLEEEKENYYPLLKSFSALGIREQGFCDSLNRDGFCAKNVIDPTLLLSKDQWREVIKSKKYQSFIPKKDYLLVYAFDEDPSIYKFIDEVAQKYNLEVCCISYDMKDEIKKYHVYQECGVEEFVALFAGASKIVTTSFHGTVFSVIFEKDFYCFSHPIFHERTDSLLSLLKLDGRNLSLDADIESVNDIDWESVRNRLNTLRDESLKFIKETIE